MFKIQDYVEFDDKGRAVCPCCEANGKTDRTLSIVPGTDGAYKCHRGCSKEDIRAQIGAAKPRQIPQALIKPPTPSKPVTVPPQKVREAHQRLIESDGPAKQWLHQRGITDEMMARYQLGVTRSKVGDRHLPSITIPLPNADGTAYYQKKRVAPWLPEVERPPEYKKWSQFGIPAMVWFTWLPTEAKQTWLCEGEWDAILLGWLLMQANHPVAVASFTCGCDAIPPDEQLELLPGEVIVFYDRNDKPLKNGKRPGEDGAKKVATKLGGLEETPTRGRARIGLVPMAPDCEVQGWDVSNAIQSGYGLQDFIKAASEAIAIEPPKNDNPLRARLTWNDDLMDKAADYIEWLVPDLLTANELFLLAAGPRAGKSLLAMTLAKAVAEGGEFLGRPVTQGTVLYVCLEDDDTKLKERELAQGWARGLPVAWIKKFKLSEQEHLRELAEELDPRLIILDTLSRIKDASVSESSAEMSQYLEPLQEMAKSLDCCILLVHHTGKVSIDNAGMIDVFDTIRGSSAIRAVCRGSMIIAAGERNYRLLVENGWGKHDLNVVLDANTLTWKLLGKWNPTVNGSQREQVIEYLKQVGSASLEQIADDLQIPKNCLYVVLQRLQASELAEEKVVKEGKRRNYTYRLALFNTTEQLNSLLNRPNPDQDSVRDRYLTKNTFSLSAEKVISDQTGTCDALITFEPEPEEEVVKYGREIGSNADTASVSPIKQLFNTADDEQLSIDGTASNSADNLAIQQLSNKLGLQVDSVVKKRGKTGWRGKIVRFRSDGSALVLWTGDRRCCRELLEDLELVEEGGNANAT